MGLAIYYCYIFFFFLLSRRPRSFQLRFCRTCGSAYSAYVLYSEVGWFNLELFTNFNYSRVSLASFFRSKKIKS